MARIPEGYALIEGPRSKERAEAVLAAARSVGADVESVSVDHANNGYIAPESVAKKLDASSVKETSSVRDIDEETGAPISVTPTELNVQEAVQANAEEDPDGTAKKSTTTSAKSSTAKTRN